MTITSVGHGFDNGDFVKIADNSLTFTCTQGGGNHTYPRPQVSQHTADTGTTYNPTTGVLSITTSSAHNLANGEWIKFDDNALTFTCQKDGGSTQHTYPRSTDPVSGRWLQIRNVSSTTFEVQVLDIVPSTNETTHNFVSGASNGITHGDPGSAKYLKVFNVSDDTFDVQVLANAPSTNTTVHTFQSASANGLQRASFEKANDAILIEDDALTFTCDADNHQSQHTYPRYTDYASDELSLIHI